MSRPSADTLRTHGAFLATCAHVAFHVVRAQRAIRAYLAFLAIRAHRAFLAHPAAIFRGCRRFTEGSPDLPLRSAAGAVAIGPKSAADSVAVWVVARWPNSESGRALEFS
jgi:hypothetical protein